MDTHRYSVPLFGCRTMSVVVAGKVQMAEAAASPCVCGVSVSCCVPGGGLRRFLLAERGGSASTRLGKRPCVCGVCVCRHVDFIDVPGRAFY